MTASLLASGTVLGHYRLGARIGRGGMGEVYEASDVVLERRVALKILTPELVVYPDRIRRFVQEAKSASALNHPHILTVHEIGQGEVEGRPMHYIAMELIDGATLRDEIHGRRAPLKRLIDVMVQVADALAKAHETGLVHRDLKPDNIMVTADGYAKVIDFGLAKLVDPGAVLRPVDTGARTLSAAGFFGTVGYMSPEQAEMRTVDHRADIFAFGCILYEACARVRAFHADSDVEVLHKIIHDPPPSLAALGDIPADLQRLIERCLEKAPSERYQSMRDVALELRAIRQDLSSERQLHLPLPRPPIASPRLAIAIAVLLTLAALATLLVLNRSSKRERPPVMEALARWPSNEVNCRFSPDGAWVSFLSDRDGKSAIWVRRIKGGEPAMLIDRPAEIISHTWSPQSDQIAYLSVEPDKRFLQFVPAFGGPPRDSIAIDEEFRDGRLIRWVGHSIYVEGREGLSCYDTVTRRMSRLVSSRAEEGRHVDFDIRADEKKIAYAVHHDNREIVWVADADGSHPVQLTSSESRYSDYRPHFAGPDLDELVLSSDRSGQIDVWRISLAAQSARQITFSPTVEWVEDVSADGELIALREERNFSNLWVCDLKAAKSQQVTAEAVQDLWPSAPARGSLVAFQRSKAIHETVPYTLNSNIFVATLSNGQLTHTRLAVEDAALPHVSPNGRWLTFVKPAKPTQYEVWLKDLESEHRWRVTDSFKPSGFYRFPVDWLESNLAWSPTGDSVYWVELRGSQAQEIRRANPATTESASVVRGDAAVRFHDLQLSPDNRWLAFVRESGRSPVRSDVMLCDLASRQQRAVFSVTHHPYDRIFCKGWRRNGELVILRGTFNADQLTENVRAYAVDLDGNQSEVQIDPRAFGGTARLDSMSDSIVLTAIDSRNFYNLIEVSLLDGRKRRLTSNRLPGISFGAVEIAANDQILFSRQEANSDLWLINFSR